MTALWSSVSRAVATGDLGGTDCEALRSGLVAQPVNTASSLAYVAAGGWAASRLGRVPRRDRWWAAAYAGLLVLIGVGSVDFHGPQSAIAKPMHDAPIAGLLLLALAIAVRGWRRYGNPVPGLTRRLAIILVAVAVAAPTSFVLGRTAAALCDPESYLQLHGLWHILTAVGFALIFQALFGGRREEPLA